MAKKKAAKPTSRQGQPIYADAALSEPLADTRSAAEGSNKPDKPKSDLAKFWHDELKAADKREDKWRKRAKKVVDRYRDERDKDNSSDRRTNILWSNTELLKGVLFQTVGNPDVRRRFPKKGQDERAARTAALVLERSLGYCKDAYDLECQIEAAVEDYLLPGRGQGWIVYDADIEYGEKASPDDVDVNAEEGEPEAIGIADQEVRFEHVYWEDFRTSAGRKEADIWWKARRHQYTRDELKEYFPDDADKIPLNAEVLDSPSTNKDDNETFKRSNVWEIWDKTKKQRVYIAEDYSLILKKDDDPYKLKDFFPCPSALYGVKTTSSLTPVPEYTLYQDQCEELDRIATRLNRQIESLKRRGVYDAGADGADSQLKQLADAGDDEFLPFKGMSGLMEKGGLKAVFQVEDMIPATVVIDKLSLREAQLVQKIYEITGISDIFRGASDPKETATAQRIKGQVGGLRIEKRKTRVQHFIRDAFRLKAEIIAEHFTREKLIEMTGIDMPLQAEIEAAKQALTQLQQMQQQAAQQAQMAQQQAQPQGTSPAMPSLPPAGQQVPPPPMPSPEQIEAWQQTAKSVAWEDIESILRSDQRRGYKIDIETTDTNGIDDQEEKASRIEFMTTMQGMIEKSVPMMMQVPALIPLMKENALFVAKAFKAGRTQEESFEEAFDALQAQAKQAAQAGPPQDPVAQAKAEQIKQEMGLAAEKHKADLQVMQGDQQLKGADLQLKQADLKAKQADMALKAQQMDMDFLHGALEAKSTVAAQEREAEAHDASMTEAHVGLHGSLADQDRQDAAHEMKMQGARADQHNRSMVAQSKATAPQGQGANGAAPRRPPQQPMPMQQPPMSGLQQALTQMAQAIAQMAETNAQVLKAVNAPRSVKIVRDAAGRAAGAVQQVMQFDQPAMGNA